MTARRTAAWRSALLTSAALVAFASNSILCRLALAPRAIDPQSFTVVRLVTGALALLAVSWSTGRRRREAHGDWISAAALAAYAAGFSFAYLDLGAGTGALILFGAVQSTMILAGLATGERPRAAEWFGLALAVCGLVALVRPGLTAPAPRAALSMAAAGVAWGLYSLRGRANRDPVASTTENFVRAAPIAVAVGLGLLPFEPVRVTGAGIALGAASGVAASGLGYVVWYAALRGLSATRAATVQLAVPILAAFGGIVILGETVTPRLLGSAALTLSGIAIAAGRRP
jgi:drug/metabolite transporter (DMT)-like permease